MRDIRLQISVSRAEYSKVQYLADANGKSVGKWVYNVLAAEIDRSMPVGSEQDRWYQLALRLKRAGQGFNELDSDDMLQRVSEAIEQGHDGQLPSGGDRPTTSQDTLPAVLATKPIASSSRGGGGVRRKPSASGETS